MRERNDQASAVELERVIESGPEAVAQSIMYNDSIDLNIEKRYVCVGNDIRTTCRIESQLLPPLLRQHMIGKEHCPGALRSPNDWIQ